MTPEQRLKRESKALIEADQDYRAAYRIIAKYHKPKANGLADWRSTRKYKQMLKRFTKPILDRKQKAVSWLKTLEGKYE